MFKSDESSILFVLELWNIKFTRFDLSTSISSVITTLFKIILRLVIISSEFL